MINLYFVLNNQLALRIEGSMNLLLAKIVNVVGINLIRGKH